MASALILIFDRLGEEHEAILASDKLSFGNVGSSLYASLQGVSIPLLVGIEEDGEVRTTDNYGNALRYVSAGVLAPLLSDHAKTAWSAAVLAFVSAVPQSTRIALSWQ